MVINLIGFLLLPVAATWGWYFGRSEPTDDASHQKTKIPKLYSDYFRGLNYLIDEQPDKAVDVFVKLIEVDSDTVEIHLTLGNLFRRRGEVDRAIRIHQNLIARPQLGKVYKLQAMAALGQDYLRAGVLDRAERLFLELVSEGGKTEQILKFLLHIYEQEKDWINAINIAEQLNEITSGSMFPAIAEYHCELALHKMAQGEVNAALEELDKAELRHFNCVRANLIRAQLALQSARYHEAIQCYQSVVEQNSDYISEVVEPICECYGHINDEKGLIAYLEMCLEKYPRTGLVIAVSHYLQKSSTNNKVAIDFVTSQIKREPTLRGLSHLVSLYLENSQGDTRDKLLMLQNFMQQLLADKPIYRCLRCGFSTKTLFWLCPSCHSWSTICPIHGIEGN